VSERLCVDIQKRNEQDNHIYFDECLQCKIIGLVKPLDGAALNDNRGGGAVVGSSLSVLNLLN